VILLTSAGGCHEAKGTEGIHADASVVKPVRQSRLLEALSSAWSKRGLAALATQVGGNACSRSSARVLVADDNEINQQVAVRMLQSLGVNADVSANGDAAVETARSKPYDLVLMDWQTRSTSGQEAAREIRKGEPPERHTPIIAMTVESGADCVSGCLASGMDDILLKPIRMEDLSATLRRWIPTGETKQLPVGQ